MLGEHAAKMWANLAWIAPYLHIPPEVLQAVDGMRKAFHVLYQFSFDETNHHMLQWYQGNITKVSYFMYYIDLICFLGL